MNKALEIEHKYTKNDVMPYLGLPIKKDGIIIKSPYIACLQDAREATGRNIDTGEKDRNKRHASWLGALAYMVFVDHIGNKFESTDEIKNERIKNINHDSDFIKALINFSEINDDEAIALYALRCSFAHDYFLLNTNTKEQLNHHFSVTAGENGKIVKLPIIRWDGNVGSRSEENKTIINLELFGDLAETMHKSIMLGIEGDQAKVKNGALLEYITYREL